MKIESPAVTAFTITGAPNLDPVRLYFEDVQKGVGRVTLTCYGQSWTAFWGNMPTPDVVTFFSGANAEYLVGRLSEENPVSDDVLNVGGLSEEARSEIVELLEKDRHSRVKYLTAIVDAAQSALRLHQQVSTQDAQS